MALIDPSRNVVVIRIVYDGPPMAGKTTSVQTLAQGLGGKVIVPEEVDGRTVFFDWLDYTGGLFEGRQIRCQIISVPGQASLASRRRHLLEGADVVVFVGDSRREHLQVTRQYLTGLQGVLKRMPGPPIGIVMQANKRDHENAADLPEVRALLDELDLKAAIVESVATTGDGIREAFVFAVRLALDRVRELLTSGDLTSSAPTIDSADDLLCELSRIEGGALNLAVESGLKHTHMDELRSHSFAAEVVESVIKSQALRQAPRHSLRGATIPEIPDENLPSGMIWPPVSGRLILHESINQTPEPQQDAQGNWSSIIDDKWILHSHVNAQYKDVNAGRNALVDWARLHVTCLHHLSRQRCVVLAEDGSGAYRLWQVVGAETSLRDELQSSLGQGVQSVASALAQSVDCMMRAAEAWSDAPMRIPLSLRTTAASLNRPTYSGLMPDPLNVTHATTRTQSHVLRIMTNELVFALPVLTASSDALLNALERRVSHSGDAGSTLAIHLIRQLVTVSTQA